MMRRLLPLLLLAACSGDPVSTATAALDNPTLPPQVGQVRLVMNGTHYWKHEPHLDGCHGTVIARRWIVTAAHCFDEFDPALGVTIDIEPYDVQLDETAVIFHPDAFGDGDAGWTTPKDGVSDVDIALVRLDAPVAASDVATLWNPPSWESQPLVGQEIVVTGYDTEFWNGGFAAGTQTILEVNTTGGVTTIETSSSPTGFTLSGGDSGGGDFIDVGNGLTAAPHGVPCVPPATASGGRGLFAINKRGGSQDQIVPLFTPNVRPWLLAQIDDDRDGDGVCDDVDNCVDVANDQANCNVLAERSDGYPGSHVELGDACDPTPCAEPSLVETDIETGESSWPYIVPGGGPKLYLCTSTKIRRVHGALALTPRIEPGASVASSATPRFCACRDAAGAPILDPDTCAGAPYYCEIDLAEAGGGVVEVGATGAPGPTETYWHRMDVGAPSAIAMSYPGATKTRAWDFAADHADWLAQGWITDLPQDPTYPAGTDLAGMLWAHDPSRAGSNEHGVGFCDGDECSLADGYATGVAADPKGTAVACKRLPWLKPAPWWTYCAMCGDEWWLPGEEVSNPAPLIALDPESGAVLAFSGGVGFDATLRFDRALKQALANRSLRWLGSPRDLGHAARLGEPRAIAIAADGTAVVGVAERGKEAFELRAVKSGKGPSARRGFAAAIAGPMVMIAGGVDAEGRALDDAWTWTAKRGWSRAALSREGGPTAVLAAAYGHADHQLWIVDAMRAGRALVRLDATTGVIASRDHVEALDGLDALSFAALPSGEMIIAGNDREGGHRLVRLRAGEKGVQVAGTHRGKGALVTAIALHGGMLQLATSVVDDTSENLVTTELAPDAVR